MLFSWPYPEAPIEGYWGKPTSLIDWCEENYVVSPYIAEWSNTITNSIFLMTAFYSTYSAWRNKLETRYILIGMGFSLVGIGSWLFHMTLQYRYQLLDELPMLYATIIPSWSIFAETQEILIKDEKKRKESSFRIQMVISFIMCGIVTILTWIYVVVQKPAIFQALYGILTLLVVVLSGWLTYYHVHDSFAKKNLFITMVMGMIPFVIGFICWQLDIHLCSFWIYIRRTYLALPLGVLLELHAWWHLLTGTGVYIFVVYLQYLRILTHGNPNDFLFIWRWGFFPELVRKGLPIGTSYSLEYLGPIVNIQVDDETKKNN